MGKLKPWTRTSNRHKLMFCTDQIKNINTFYCPLQNVFLKKNSYSVKHLEKTALLTQNQIPMYFYLLCWHTKAYGQLTCLSAQRLWVSHLGCHSWHIVNLGLIGTCDLFARRENGLLLYLEEKQRKENAIEHTQ